jgi:predicted XRE-type DNA-binding protein
MIIKKYSNTSEQILSDLLNHTTPQGECLEWNGCFNTDGYARMGFRGDSNVKVHRFVARLSYNRDIAGLVVRHTCDNIKCINPQHLVLGTPADNVRDRGERGRTYKIITKDLVAKVKALMATKQVTQKEVASLVGINPRRVSDIVNGRYNDEGKLCR